MISFETFSTDGRGLVLVRVETGVVRCEKVEKKNDAERHRESQNKQPHQPWPYVESL